MVVARAHRGRKHSKSAYFEIARDRMLGIVLYDGSNVFLGSFYDISMMFFYDAAPCASATDLDPIII